SDDHGWSSVPVAKDGERGPWLTGGSAHPLAMDGRVSLKPEDTVFARIKLLAGWREGTLCTAPCLGSVA
ncbi:MAG: hypothetical protein P4L59_13900, partial [Desulfosporosinus sp.]|nr:hypothetical protein [Desulfosporosinus sp.]